MSICEDCGRELSFRDAGRFKGKDLCPDCLTKYEPKRTKNARSGIPGGAPAVALKVIGILGIIGGIIYLLMSLSGEIAAVFLGASCIVSGILFVGIASIIELLIKIVVLLSKD